MISKFNTAQTNSSASVEVDFNEHNSFLALRPRKHGKVFVCFCVVSSNELIVLDHL